MLKKDQLWLLGYIVLFVMILECLLIIKLKSVCFSPMHYFIFLLIIISGVVLGVLIFNFLYDKKIVFKIISLLLLTVILIFQQKYIYNHLFATCEICGYKAVDYNTKECKYCGSVIWEQEKKLKRYPNKREWIFEEQLDWFADDTIDGDILFYSPKYDDGYFKDTNWVPIVSKGDIIKE